MPSSNNLSLLEGLEFTPPSSARTKGDTRYIRTWYKYVYEHFLFDFSVWWDSRTSSFFHSRAFFFGKLTKSGIPGWFLNKIGYLFSRDGARLRNLPVVCGIFRVGLRWCKLLALSCSSVTADLCAAAAASQSSQSATCQLCERSWAKDFPRCVEGRRPFPCLPGSNDDAFHCSSCTLLVDTTGIQTTTFSASYDDEIIP